MLSSRGPLLGLVLTLVLASCSGGPAATPTPGPTGPEPTASANPFGFDPADLPECQYPPSVKMPGWVPEDLPLPPGTYATERLSTLQGYHRVLLAVQRPLQEFVDFVFDRFPSLGWVVGRGDQEPGETDIQFTKAPAVGAFRALDQFCRPGFTLVLVIYAPDREAIVAPVPITPNPNATPIG